jgi:hypothetical protein
MKNQGLEIATDLKHQRRLWVVERVGWTVMGLLIVAGLAGLFGSGPLSRASAGQPGSALRVEYERFGRYEAPSELKLSIGAEQVQGSMLRVWISRDYLDRVEVERTMPPCDVSQLDVNRVIYVFNLAQTNKPAMITFYVRPTAYGKTRGNIGIVGGPEVPFSEFVYP